MGKVYDRIDERLRSWIDRQHVFFVATAPEGGGHVNCSPKGLSSLRVVGDREVAYLDFIGSGAETLAHLRENGRITLMFCAFEGPPKIVRLHGKGDVVEPGDPDWDALSPDFAPGENARSIVRVRVERISDSCGYGVPLMAFERERTQLDDWAARKSPEQLRQYQRDNNLESIDGLPALRGEQLR